MSTERNIVIVGGGFAGTTLVRELDGKLPPGYRLLLISEESHTTFNPMLPEAVGASIFPEQVVAPIREMITKAHFIMGRVNQVDPARRTLTASTLAGDITFPYEHLLLAFGNRARLDLIPGTRAARVAAEDRRRRDAHPQHGAAPGRANRARDRCRPSPTARALRHCRWRLLGRRDRGRADRLPGQHPALLSPCRRGRAPRDASARRPAPAAGIVGAPRRRRAPVAGRARRRGSRRRARDVRRRQGGGAGRRVAMWRRPR